jgi:hypothetical protein
MYEFFTLSREFKFWKTAPGSWESWMLSEPGEVGRDEAQRKIEFGPVWFKNNAKERLKVFESWQNLRPLRQVVAKISSRTPLMESVAEGEKNTNAKTKSLWKGSIRKRMLGGML